MALLGSLSAACGVPGTEVAQRFLASAFDSVENVLSSFETIRELRKQAAGSIKGRLPANEEDLLRAAIIFSGAGLDASLKQLIRAVLPPLLLKNGDAQEKFEAFAASKLGTGEIADTRAIARYLTTASPRDLLIEDYVYELTGSSLQSAEEVQKAAGALGITDGALRKRIGGLRSLFTARNEIAHELDLRQPQRQGDRARRTRKIDESIDLCLEGLEVGQQIINAAGILL